MARRFLVILASVSLVIAAAPPTRGQPGQLDVALIRQPVWHAPGDSLAIRLRLSNPGPTAISGYIVTVAAHARVLSRSELHDSFEVPATFQASLITAIDAPDEEIPPGGRVVREIDQPVDELQSIALTSESGVYPLTVSVLDRSGAVLASVSTQLIYYPTPPEFRLPAV
ncbi:MAG: hypothetical protein KY391_00965, partial [Actinobacteria bacterium]|nr:hypothetical protein [Actinomycetota bacterium]